MTGTDTVAAFSSFVREVVAPGAEEWELAGAVPDSVVEGIAATGVLGARVPAAHGGQPLTHLEYGEANRLLAMVSASAQSLLSVHGMVCGAVARWASEEARERFLPALATGSSVGAFALTERGAGSDVRTLATAAVPRDGGWCLDGEKRWITFGLVADLFLVFAATPDGDACFLVRRDDPGVSTVPAPRTSGFRAARLAELRLDGCVVPADRLVGRPGFAVAQVATRALTLGRLCVAFGALGLAQACEEAMLAHVTARRQFGGALKDLQLVRGLMSDTAVAVASARLLCVQAATAMDTGDEAATRDVLLAKLAASRAARTAADVTAQLHGAEGLTEHGPVDRRVADSRVMEVIEGSTQLVQHLLADHSVARWRAAR